MKLLLNIFVLLLAGQVFAQSPTNLFKEANAAYTSGDFPTAIAGFEEILTKGKHSSTLYYNLGNAYYRQNQIGKAILNYERALLFAPRNKDIQHNLAIAENKRKDNIVPIPPFFLAVWWKGIYQLFSPTLSAILGILMLCAMVGGIGLWLLDTERKRKQQGFYGAVAALVLAILFLSMGNSYRNARYNSGMAIVTAPKTDFKDGADELSNTISTLHEGVKVELLQNINEWQKVRLENGEVGWLLNGSFEEI